VLGGGAASTMCVEHVPLQLLHSLGSSTSHTERRGQVVNTHASYLGGAYFKFGPETRYPD
jgi:hypothetical protein